MQWQPSLAMDAWSCPVQHRQATAATARTGFGADGQQWSAANGVVRTGAACRCSSGCKGAGGSGLLSRSSPPVPRQQGSGKSGAALVSTALDTEAASPWRRRGSKAMAAQAMAGLGPAAEPSMGGAREHRCTKGWQPRRGLERKVDAGYLRTGYGSRATASSGWPGKGFLGLQWQPGHARAWWPWEVTVWLGSHAMEVLARPASPRQQRRGTTSLVESSQARPRQQARVSKRRVAACDGKARQQRRVLSRSACTAQ
jgi:hypothetical protein